MKILKLSIQDKQLYNPILKRASDDLSIAIEVVKPIIHDVEKRGDIAIKEYTKKFDRVNLDNFKIDAQNIKVDIADDLKKAFEVAKDNIKEFHKIQIQSQKQIQVSGNQLGIKYTPVDSVAVYAPGGKALYPSSILMGAIPAKLAGVKKVNLITPPASNGKISDVIIFVAQISGIDNIYTIGGSQAIAAVGYGTETVEKSEFVVGPGNNYVAAAKVYLSGIGKIGIESPAGPSEILVIADQTANPEWIASDMLSQAEHGEDSSAILCTDSELLAQKVNEEIQLALKNRIKRQEIKTKAINNHSYILVFPNIDECIEFSNLYAPEHLEIVTQDYWRDFEKIRHAGSVFLGPYSPVAMGDYISGTNHVLPTAGGSRIYSSLGVDTFLKRITFQEIKKDSLRKLYPYIKSISEFEGLDEEHGTSVYLRTKEKL